MPAVQHNLLLSRIILIANRAHLLTFSRLFLHKGFVHASFGTKQQTFVNALFSILKIFRNSLSKGSLSPNEVRILPSIDQHQHEQKEQSYYPSDFNIKLGRIHSILHVLYLLILACLFRLTILSQSINAARLSVFMRVNRLTDFPTIVSRCLRALQFVLDLFEPFVLLDRRDHQRDWNHQVKDRGNKKDLKGESALAKGRTPAHKLKW